MSDLVGQHRLATLVDRACSKKAQALDGHQLAAIKALCKQSDDNVRAAFEMAWEKLRSGHSQSRLLALQLCAELFERSRVFRQALSQRLSQFLVLTVGHRSEEPLPAPAPAAASLRELALQLLERWAKHYGAHYKQLVFAYRYLHDTLKLDFPEIDARAAAAAAEQAARRARAQAQLRADLARLWEGKWREGSAECELLLRQVDECFELLKEQKQQQEQRAQRARQEAQRAAAAGAAAEGHEGLQWEDVAAEPETLPAAEGLAAYALDSQAGTGGSAAGPIGEGGVPGTSEQLGGSGSSAAGDAVLETLEGLQKQLSARALPLVQGWLRLLGRVEPEGRQQEEQRQQMLRSAAELRGRLEAAQGRYESAALDLTALLLRRRQREAAAAVEAAVHDLFGGSSSDGEEASGGEERDSSQGGRGSRSSGRAGQGEAAAEAFNPYHHIRDPAAPLPQGPNPAATAAAAAAARQASLGGVGAAGLRSGTQGAAAAPAAGGAHRSNSSLPEGLKRKLAEQAPILPTGTHTIFWDSKSVPTYVSGHGLEVNNHWGPVDVHQELPQERVDELFMLPLPASRAQQQRPAGAAGALAGARPTQQQQRAASSHAGGTAAAQRQQASQPELAASAVAQLPAPPSARAAAAEIPIHGVSGEDRATKRAGRAAERAYNEAVISGAFSDEQLARRLQEAAQGGAVGGGQQQRAPQAKRKMGVRERLSQKLLRGGALEQAAREAASTADERFRDRFGVTAWDVKHAVRGPRAAPHSVAPSRRYLLACSKGRVVVAEFEVHFRCAKGKDVTYTFQTYRTQLATGGKKVDVQQWNSVKRSKDICPASAHYTPLKLNGNNFPVDAQGQVVNAVVEVAHAAVRENTTYWPKGCTPTRFSALRYMLACMKTSAKWTGVQTAFMVHFACPKTSDVVSLNFYAVGRSVQGKSPDVQVEVSKFGFYEH